MDDQCFAILAWETEFTTSRSKRWSASGWPSDFKKRTQLSNHVNRFFRFVLSSRSPAGTEDVLQALANGGVSGACDLVIKAGGAHLANGAFITATSDSFLG